jgi:hypothetical protein
MILPGFFVSADSKGVRDGTAGNEGEDVGVDGQQFKVERGKIRRAKRGEAEGAERRRTKSRSLTTLGITVVGGVRMGAW